MHYVKKGQALWLRLEESWRVAIVAFLAARIFYALWSLAVLTIEPTAVHYVDIDNRPAVIFLDLYSANIHTFYRDINGQPLNFRPKGQNTVIDVKTGSVWDTQTGMAVQGYEQGNKLSPAKYNREDIFPYHNVAPYPNAWLAVWQRFDANWYIALAQNGYGNIDGDNHYPPLYPLLIKLILPIVGNAFIAGLVISHIATLIAIRLLYDLFTQWGGQQSGKSTLFYFLLYPTSFYLFSAYSESLFLVIALLSFRSMQKQSWGWAGFWIFCAINTRLQGTALLVPMLYLIWKSGSFLRKVEHWAGLAFGLSGCFFYLFMRSSLVPGNAIPFNEPAWHAHLVLPWETYFYAIQTFLSGQSNYVDLINLFVVTMFIILLIVGWRKIPPEYNLYSVFSLLIMLTRIVENQPLVSMSRYSLTIFPLFFIIRLIDKHAWGKRAVIYTCLALSLFLSQLFFVWGWVA